MRQSLLNTDHSSIGSIPTDEFCLIGRCARCGIVNAIDIENTPEHLKEMEMSGRIITVVPRLEVKDL